MPHEGSTVRSGGAEPAPRLRVLHVITRMIVGGAQENTMLSCALIDPERFPSEILCGPQTGAEGELWSECARRGVPLHIEPALVRELAPGKDLTATVRLARFMRAGGYDVVHVHTSKAGIVGRIAARSARVPVVIHTAHGWAFNREQPLLLRLFYVAAEWLCARLCDAIVVVASTDREVARKFGIGRDAQFTLIRSGVEVEAFRDCPLTQAEARQRLGIPADAFVVGTVGRLSRQKAPLELLAAFRLLAARCPNARLVFVGDGPLRAELVAAIAACGLTDRVLLTGVRRDVPELMRALDVFALSSRWEGLPRVFPQAMAAGLPIVATRVDGAPDAIEEGRNGHLVDVGDMARFAERLIALANDPERRYEMGACGRERVAEFSAQRMVDQLAELYTALASRQRVRA